MTKMIIKAKIKRKNNFKYGQQVRYNGKYPDKFTPPKGTIGTVIHVAPNGTFVFVQWPENTTPGDGQWAIYPGSIDLVE